MTAEQDQAAWRAPSQILAHWGEAHVIETSLLAHEISGDFFGLLHHLGVTLLVSREYEHFIVGLQGDGDLPHQTFLPLPHPSGIAVDAAGGCVYTASTRNPNQVFTLRPVAGVLPRVDREAPPLPHGERPLVPVASSFLPGALYLHDLVFAGGALYGTAVGINAVIRIEPTGHWRAVWHPASIEGSDGPDRTRNYLQLNSIAWGGSLEASAYTASLAAPGSVYMGDPALEVDRKGVLLDGATRDVSGTGLTRPHSARWHEGEVWVANSGYGEAGVVRDGRFEARHRLPGWTRGLCFAGHHLIIATSRVLPRFESYAPGLDPAACVCGVHIIDLQAGGIAAALTWPSGNQVFAVEAVPDTLTSGFPFDAEKPTPGDDLLYAFDCFQPH